MNPSCCEVRGCGDGGSPLASPPFSSFSPLRAARRIRLNLSAERKKSGSRQSWRIAPSGSSSLPGTRIEEKRSFLDFFDGITLWAQYSEENRAVSEWEVSAEGYRIEQEGTSVITIHPDEPGSRRQFPEECVDCIPTSRFSISIRNVSDPERISFKLNDPGNNLPSPFPVFKSWTRFREDEIFD